MDNYVYIVASLPELALNFDEDRFSYEDTKAHFIELLSEKDRKLVELLERGFDEANLGQEFYAEAAKSKNVFLREYFDFDARLRNMQAGFLAQRLNRDAETYLVEMPEADFEESKQIQAVFESTDFVAREQQIDQLKWNKATEIAMMDYFNMNAILAYLVKAKMVQRWVELDKDKGEEMFRRLVKEIRGTSAKLNFETGGKM
ncbi:MAG: DUF2764 family protein [Candidatus Limimorpha sp.]